MEQANILLALGGDARNQVPKYGVTAAEIKILQALHGDDSVTDVEPLDDEALGPDDETRTPKEELARLSEIYRDARIDDGNGSRRFMIGQFFPVASAIPTKLSDLDIPEEFYKAVEREKPSKKKAEAKDTKASKKSKRDQQHDEVSDADAAQITGVQTPGDDTKVFE